MTTSADLLRRAVEASGMSARRFATEVMIRDERTIRRWLAGEYMPDAPRQWLERWEADGFKPLRIPPR